MNKKDKSQIKAQLDMSEELSDEARTELIRELLRQQRRLSSYDNKEKENCTLIDLRKGIIVGSSICPTCNGWLGRDLDYED